MMFNRKLNERAKQLQRKIDYYEGIITEYRQDFEQYKKKVDYYQAEAEIWKSCYEKELVK